MKWLDWIRSWWRGDRKETLPPKTHNRPPAPPKDETTHYYFDDLLADLDDYFDVITFMRKSDPATYALYRQVGAQVLAKRMDGETHTLPAEWRGGNRMGLGMVHLPRWDMLKEHEKNNTLPCSFVSFQQKKRSAFHHLSNGSSLYEVAMFYQDDRRKKMFGGDFIIEVDAAGTPHLLKIPHVTMVRLPIKKHGIDRGPRTYPARTWNYGFLEGAIDDLKHRKPDTEFVTTEAYGKALFCLAVNYSYFASGGLQVRVKKHGVTARFNISMLRTPYFFKNRQKTVTVNGRTKPIFHIVRAHRRIVAGGLETFVKSHFRGVRRFQWLEYDVTVSMPDRHHGRLEALDIASYEEGDPEIDIEKTAGPGKAGHLIDKLLND